MSGEKEVYFIRPVGMDGPIKIGCSDNPQQRLTAFGPWSPYPLELVGSVPGGVKEEKFLHHSFADVHSHREWFHSSPNLREAIRLILAANSVNGARELLEPIKHDMAVRKSNRIVRSPEHQKFLDLQAAANAAERAERNKYDWRDEKDKRWRMPGDIRKMLSRWNSAVYRGLGFNPSHEDLARVEEYLADPATHSVLAEFYTRHMPTDATHTSAGAEA